jgi:hypothetical protein
LFQNSVSFGTASFDVPLSLSTQYANGANPLGHYYEIRENFTIFLNFYIPNFIFCQLFCEKISPGSGRAAVYAITGAAAFVKKSLAEFPAPRHNIKGAAEMRFVTFPVF